MAQLLLAYLFAAGTTITIVYLARQNRKQGWQRPAAKWFGVQLEDRQPVTPSTPLAAGSEPVELLPQLLTLNRALAAHGAPTKPAVESPATPELVSTRRV
jgi:hypothetical protein